MNIQDIVLFLAHCALFLWLGRKYGNEIVAGLKGQDGLWNHNEVTRAVAVVLLIIAFLINSFLNYEISHYIWATIDVLIIGKDIIDYLKTRNDNKNK